MTIKVALAGAGAFGIKHLDGIKNIDGVEVISLIGRELDKTQEVATKYGIQHVTTDLAESLALKELDAVILCTRGGGISIPNGICGARPILTRRGRGILIRACQFDNLVFALPWGCVTRGSGFLLYFVTVVDRFYRPIFLEVE